MNEQQKIIFPIIAALIVAIFPHIGRLPLWITLWCALMWGYLLLSIKYNWPRPGKKIRRLLAVIGIFGLAAAYSRHLGQNAYLGLLAVMAALKPFEMEAHRDRMVTVFLAYFIVITSLFLSETLAITLYMLLSVTITTAVLIRINDVQGRFKNHLRLSVTIMAQAVPLMIILFLLFPRIQGSLFGLSLAGSAKSGFSDSMAPGSVASLVESDEVAFRAQFEDTIPSPDLLYWRGIVFEDFDGRRWHARKRATERDRPPEGRFPVAYTITLEAHQQRWLFALEMPATVPPQARLFEDYTLRSRRRITRTLRYEMTSHTDYQSDQESTWQLARSRDLPEGYNVRTRKYAAEITKDAPTVDEKIRRLLDFFRSGNFSYTLRPPRLGRDSVDDFIFKSKRGYCEHFASAFAFMARSVDIPARIVGGYQGGERNPYADYLIVRQSEAHVWVEVWDDEKGWYRVDPTAVVVPQRITQGIESALSPEELPDFLLKQFNLLKQIQFRWDALSTRWSALFEGYSYNEQRKLLEKIGITSGVIGASIKALLLLLGVVGLFFIAYAWFVLRTVRRKPDIIKKHYTLLCEKLSRAGLPRKSYQGPVDYMNYVSGSRPDLKNKMTEIMDLYIGLRYRGRSSETQLSEFIKKVRAFDPTLK